MKLSYIDFNNEHIPLGYLISFRGYGTWLHGYGLITSARITFTRLSRRSVSRIWSWAHSKRMPPAQWKKPDAGRGTGSPWSYRGSKKYLWTEKQLTDAIAYVECEQGEPLLW